MKFLAPEVIQSSALDCGPAALKALVEGFGISASYGRLREACRTGVDGTSIDAVEVVARQLGVDAEQVMLPADHLLVPEASALPAVVVVRNPGGATHFVVAWRAAGGLVQVMDPATGRRWRTRERFLADLYVHYFPVAAAAWKEWTRTAEFTATLRARLDRLGMEREIPRLLDDAYGHECWRGVATLDAAARLTASLVAARGITRGAQAGRALRALVDEASARPDAETDAIPTACWMVRPHPAADDGEERLLLRGAVLVRAKGRLVRPSPSSAPSPEVRAALDEPPARPGRRLLRMLREDGVLAPAAIGAALAASAAGVVCEALVFRALLDVGRELGTPGARGLVFISLLLLSLALLLLDFGAAGGLRRMGRRLETRLRVAFLTRLPLLGDRYFGSRLTSDMAERGHAVHALRALPELGGRMVGVACALALTTAAVAWLDPPSAGPALLGAAVALLVPPAMHGFVAERDLRVRSHQGALARFYLDALLGLTPVRAHGAERSVRREHEMLAAEWARAALGLFRAAATAELAAGLAGFGIAAWTVLRFVDRAGASGPLLLLAYWSLSIPVLGQALGVLARQYPTYRNVALRLFEPLSAKVREAESAKVGDDGLSGDGPKGVRIEMRGVAVEAAGTTILHDVRLSIAPGEHVAVVGPSGAGKSTLVGLLLGWHRASGGSIAVDGREMDEAALGRLRSATAWVDPAVRLWNRSMAENLRYGADTGALGRMGAAVDAAGLRGVVQRLPTGLQTPLGEGGGLVSGGEGQRVRLGRALLRPDARLAVLDEPFRGLDREARRALLARAREVWRDATLLCVTHDVGETLRFPRVIVVEDGSIAEDGAPAELAARDSRYRRLLDAEAEVRDRLWSGARWRRLRLADGALEERS
jgi:ABC-type transport system involved in cytochrome bd biosynthesis fused ATPase/permease subunit/predicted double-glycine peptidase